MGRYRGILGLVAAVAVSSGMAIVAGAKQSDPKAAELLKKVQEANKRIRTFTADSVSNAEFGQTKQKNASRLTIKRPNRIRAVMTGDQPGVFVFDGNSATMYMQRQKQYMTLTKQMATGASVGMAAGNFGIASLLEPKVFEQLGKATYVGKEKVDGVECQVIKADEPGTETRLYIDPRYLIRRTVIKMNRGQFTGSMESTLRNVVINQPVADTVFRYKPPKGATQFKMPTGGEADYDARLIKVGAAAPKFALPNPKGGEVTVDGALQGKKALLVNFWFYGWGACREEFPHLQKLYTELKEKGLELVAVNSTDDQATVNKYLDENKFSFLVGMEDVGDKHYKVSEKYGVRAYPTNYVLDPGGKVVFRSTGFDEAGIRKALEKLGVK